MKKIKILILVLLTIIVIDILFSRLLPNYLKPNLFLVYVVFFSLFVGHYEAVIIGFICGILLDLMYLKIFGFNSFLLTFIGYIVGWFHNKLDEHLKMTQILILSFTNILYLILCIISSWLLKISLGISWYFFILNIVITTLFGFIQLQVLSIIYKYKEQ